MELPAVERRRRPYQEGFRNRLLTSLGQEGHSQEQHYLDEVVPFKVSFVGLGDVWGHSSFVDVALARANPGWLVSFDEQDLGSLIAPNVALGGAFNRLNLDGSVVHRPSQKVGPIMHYLWLFSDPTDAERTKDKVFG